MATDWPHIKTTKNFHQAEGFSGERRGRPKKTWRRIIIAENGEGGHKYNTLGRLVQDSRRGVVSGLHASK